MKDEGRLGTTQRRLWILLVVVSVAQALLWGVGSIGDSGVVRAVLAVAFIGIAICGVIVLSRERGKRHTR